MARYKVQSPDGQIHEIEGPDGASEAEVIAQAQKLVGTDVSRETMTAAPADKSMLQKVGGFVRDNLAGQVRGAASIGSTLMLPIDRASDLIAGRDTTGPNSSNELRRAALGGFMRDTAGADTDSAAYGVGKLGAEIAGTAGVGPALGYGRAVMAVAPRVASAIRSGGMTVGAGGNAIANLATRAAGGAITGGASAGLIDPNSAGAGAAAGGVLPPILAGAGGMANVAGRGIRSLVEPMTDAGRDAIRARFYQDLLGAEAPQAAVNIREAFRPAVGPFPPGQEKTVMGEFVPGSVPTTAQAARNVNVNALEHSQNAINPEVKAGLDAQFASQNTARRNALEELAGTDGKRDMFAASRGAAADQLYNEAYAKGVDLRRDAASGAFLSKAAQAGRRGEINKLLATPAMQEAVQQAQVLMRNEMKNVSSPAGSVQGLDYVRRALGDMIGNAGGNEQRVLMGLRDRLDTTLNTISPKYAEARSTFAEMSKPINEMDIARKISADSVNPLTGVLSPASFARSVGEKMGDKTAAGATGFRGATLENQLSPKATNEIERILEDFQRANAAQTRGRGINSDTVNKLAYGNMVSMMGVPKGIARNSGGQLVGNLIGRGADAVYGRFNREIANQVGQDVLDPQQFARLLEMSRSNPGALPPGLRRLLSNPIIASLPYRAAPALSAGQ